MSAGRCAKGRGAALAEALLLLRWLEAQDHAEPLRAGALARDAGIGLRTAYRWLAVAEGVGLVERRRGRFHWWSPAPPARRARAKAA